MSTEAERRIEAAFTSFANTITDTDPAERWARLDDQAHGDRRPGGRARVRWLAPAAAAAGALVLVGSLYAFGHRPVSEAVPAVTGSSTASSSSRAPLAATSGPTGPTGPGDVRTAPKPLVVGVAYPFDLSTHCGVREALVGGTYFEADSPLVGPGNPPKGWATPYQRGTMSLVSASTAEFRDTAGHVIRFHARPGATGFKTLCD